MATNLHSLHAWLQRALPATVDEIMTDLNIGHQALPDAYAGMPLNSLELVEALWALEKFGLVDRDGGIWKWKAKVVKVDPQRSLFA